MTTKYPDRIIYDCLSRFTFIQTSEIIKKSKILICCDDRLLHATNSVSTQSVALFARLAPRMQLSEKVICFSVYDEDVNNIDISLVLKKYEELTSFLSSHPPV